MQLDAAELTASEGVRAGAFYLVSSVIAGLVAAALGAALARHQG